MDIFLPKQDTAVTQGNGWLGEGVGWGMGVGHTHQVGVPQPDDTPQWYLPHQQVVHPAEREL